MSCFLVLHLVFDLTFNNQVEDCLIVCPCAFKNIVLSTRGFKNKIEQTRFSKSNQGSQDSSGNQKNVIQGQTLDMENRKTQQEHKVTKIIHTK